MQLQLINICTDTRANTGAEKGFTLIEMMISMLIGLIVMAGGFTAYFSHNSTLFKQAGDTESITDLHFASQFMQRELRSAVGTLDKVAGSFNSGFDYTPDVLDVDDGSCNAPKSYETKGHFRIGGTTITWKKPACGEYVEILGGLRPIGLNISEQTLTAAAGGPSPTVNIYTFTLTKDVVGFNRGRKYQSLQFVVNPRNI